LVDLASPSIDAAVEVDCVVKAGVSEKVDDHLTASAMMANDYQWLIRREIVGARWNLRHRNMQSAFQLANIKLSLPGHREPYAPSPRSACPQAREQRSHVIL
jgi:hypothetical protein